MSIFDSLGRYGAAIRNAREHKRTVRALNNLHPDIQKDIGWSGSTREHERATIINAMVWGKAR